MPAFSNIIINDGAATPVSHTFAPQTRKGDVFTFQDRASGIPAGYPTITAAMQDTKSGLSVLRYKIMLPVLETLGSGGGAFVPPPTVAYTLMADCKFIIPKRSALQERKDFRAFCANAMGNAGVQSVFNNLEWYYG